MSSALVLPHCTTKRKIVTITRTMTDLKSLEQSDRDSSDNETLDETLDEREKRQIERLDRDFDRIQEIEGKVWDLYHEKDELHHDIANLYRERDKLDDDIRRRRLWKKEAYGYLDSLSKELQSLLRKHASL